MSTVPWTVVNHDAFDPEFEALPEAVQDELLAMSALLAVYGPQLDTRNNHGFSARERGL